MPLPIEALIARCESDRACHMVGSACSEVDIRLTEQALGDRLPAPFRLFLSHLGGGVFYLKHEIFGARRVMIHDIEIVPDLVSFRARVDAEARRGVVPIHRADGLVHVLEIDTGAVRALGNSGAQYPDFASFLLQVVMPSGQV